MEDKIQWSSKTSSYHRKWNNTPNPEDTDKGFRKVWLLDAQWSDCPIEVENEVKKMWKSYDLGNDNYVIKTDIDTLQENNTLVAQYVKEQAPEIAGEELILIHWWW